MDTIAGNFETYDEEIDAVGKFLKDNGYDLSQCSITKFGGDDEKDTNVMSASDVVARLPGGRKVHFEVKQEGYSRFFGYTDKYGNKKGGYGELGIDFISVFHFKKGKERKGFYKPYELKSFLETVDMSSSKFKWGKLDYSKADVWLFYVKDNNGNYAFCKGYDYPKMKSDNFISKIKNTCPFAVNNKNKNQMSRFDTWESATFFVKPELISAYELSQSDLNSMNDFTSQIFS